MIVSYMGKGEKRKRQFTPADGHSRALVSGSQRIYKSRKAMKKVKISTLASLFAILLIYSFALAQKGPLLNNFKPGSEPDGFRDTKWGTNISTLKDMILKEEDLKGLLKIYRRKGDVLEIGAAKLKSISYSFWQGKLIDVLIQTEEFSGEDLKNVCFEKFGQDAKMSRHREDYRWDGKMALILLSISANKGALLIQSQEIVGQQETYEKQKAKEGAKKGF